MPSVGKSCSRWAVCPCNGQNVPAVGNLCVCPRWAVAVLFCALAGLGSPLVGSGSFCPLWVIFIVAIGGHAVIIRHVGIHTCTCVVLVLVMVSVLWGCS